MLWEWFYVQLQVTGVSWNCTGSVIAVAYLLCTERQACDDDGGDDDDDDDNGDNDDEHKTF